VHPRVAHIALALLTLTGWHALDASNAHAEPPQFGVEIEAGTGAGLTPYLRNHVRTEVDRTRTDDQGRFLLAPQLADRRTSQGTSVAARLVATNIAAGLSVRWFDLVEDEIHHVGQRPITEDRLRPDGSVDDSGVDYQPLRSPIRQTLPEDEREHLLLIGLDGEYRFIWPTETVDIFVPVGAGLVYTHVRRPAAPFRLGVQANTGVGAAAAVFGGVSLVLTGRIHGLATTHYGRRSDAAHRAVAIGESTESAFFSTLAYGTISLGLQFTIR
jgi:hypothetical protein